MYEPFTDRAAKVLHLANSEAQRAGSERVEPQHILLAILTEARGVAAHVLSNLGVDLAAARATAEKLVLGDRAPAKATSVQLPLSPPAMSLLSQARTEARSLNHSYVGTEHLLLALALDQIGGASRTMTQIGIDPTAARSQIAALAPSHGEQPAGSQAAHGEGKIRVGIAGVSGYGGGETLRLCALHPNFHVTYVAGESSAGSRLGERFRGLPPQLAELTIQPFNPAELPAIDLLFASLPTGQSRDALSRVRPTTSIVDIGGDHRFADGWTYGLADIWPERIRASTRVANPGCYPAAAITALAPLLHHKLIEPSNLIIDAKSGVSGAGRGGGSTLGFAELNEDVAAYGLLSHSHASEMCNALGEISRAEVSLTFTPHLIPMTRGLLATCYARGTVGTAECLDAARAFYANRSFVRVVDQPPHTKWASGTNVAFVSYAADADRGVVIALCAIDNLGKGAAGQAVQNANLMTGQPESLALESLPLFP